MNKKILIGSAVGILMLAGSSLPVFAVTPENFGGSGDVFTNDYANHYVNNNNPEVRFDWDNDRIAVPGSAYENINESSAVIDNGGYSLVDPHNTL